MQTLRRFTFLSRLVLAWFVLSLGVATASTLVEPQDLVLVCTGSSAMKLLVKSADGDAKEVSSNSMHCPLCVSPAAPPPVVRLGAETAQPLSYALQPIAAAHIAARTATPLPARGPPSA